MPTHFHQQPARRLLKVSNLFTSAKLISLCHCFILINPFFFSLLADDSISHAQLLQEVLPKFQLPDFMPADWLLKFEDAVSDWPDVRRLGFGEDSFKFSLLPSFLYGEDSEWFIAERSKCKKSWAEFKKDFVDHFSSKYWQLMVGGLDSRYKVDQSLYEFVCKKVDGLESLFPLLHKSSILAACCASLPEEYSHQLSESIDQGPAVFKERAKEIELKKSQLTGNCEHL